MWDLELCTLDYLTCPDAVLTDAVVGNQHAHGFLEALITSLPTSIRSAREVMLQPDELLNLFDDAASSKHGLCHLPKLIGD